MTALATLLVFAWLAVWVLLSQTLFSSEAVAPVVQTIGGVGAALVLVVWSLRQARLGEPTMEVEVRAKRPDLLP